MTSPEQAAQRAREAAAQRRAEGAYADELPGYEVDATSRIGQRRLAEWAVVEPDPDLVYSTRALGAPITWVKRALLRALRQYHGQMVAEQNRFNAHLVAQVMSLDDRVQRLEREAGGAAAGDPEPPGPPQR